MPYLLEKSRFGINFLAKKTKNTILLLYMHQVFIFLQDHLHFVLHFFFTFMGQCCFLTDNQWQQRQTTVKKKSIAQWRQTGNAALLTVALPGKSFLPQRQPRAQIICFSKTRFFLQMLTASLRFIENNIAWNPMVFLLNPQITESQIAVQGSVTESQMAV